jgi:hypothetical protein
MIYFQVQYLFGGSGRSCICWTGDSGGISGIELEETGSSSSIPINLEATSISIFAIITWCGLSISNININSNTKNSNSNNNTSTIYIIGGPTPTNKE